MAQKPEKGQTEKQKGLEKGQENLWFQSNSCHRDPWEPSRIDLACKGPKDSWDGRSSLEVQLPPCECYEESMVWLMRNPLFANPLDSNKSTQWLTTKKRFWQERRFAERTEGKGCQGRSFETFHCSFPREIDSMEGIHAYDTYPEGDAGEAGDTVSRRSGCDPPYGDQRQGEGWICGRAFNAGFREGRPAGAGRSHPQSTRGEHDRRDEKGTREDVMFTGEAKAQTHTLTFEQGGTCSQVSRSTEKKNPGARHGLGQIQEGGGDSSSHPKDELPRAKKDSQRSVCPEGRAAETSSVGTPKGSEWFSIRSDRFGGWRRRDRARFRCGTRGDPGHRRELGGTQAPKTSEDGTEQGRCLSMSTYGYRMNLAPNFKARQFMRKRNDESELSIGKAVPFEPADCMDGQDGISPLLWETVAVYGSLLMETTNFEEVNTLDNDLNHTPCVALPLSMVSTFGTKHMTWAGESATNASLLLGGELRDLLWYSVIRDYGCEKCADGILNLTKAITWNLSCDHEYWFEILFDDEWIAFFFGTMIVAIFLGLCSLLADGCCGLTGRWFARGKCSNYEENLVIVCRRRCRQRKFIKKSGGDVKRILLQYLLCWHLWFPLVAGSASVSFHLQERNFCDREEMFMMQRTESRPIEWEDNLREWIGVDQARANLTLVRVWQHQWRRRYVSDSLGQNLWVDKRMNVEEQIRRQLLFMDGEDPIQWFKVTPTPQSHPYHRTHVLATGIPYPFFLAVLAEMSNGERTWYQTVITEHRQNVVELVDFFNLAWKDNRCAEDHECYTLQPHRTDWPDSIDIFGGELISILHIPRERERTQMNGTSSGCTEVGSERTQLNSSDDDYVAMVSSMATFNREHSGSENYAAGLHPDSQRLGSELGRRMEETRAGYDNWEENARREAHDHAQVQGQERITNGILEMAAHRGDGQVRLHVHGILLQEARVEKIWLNTHLIRDFHDLLVILRGLWLDVRPSLDMNLHYVQEQPTTPMNSGHEAFTVIMDLQPQARWQPILIITRLVQRGFEDSYDIKSHKTGPLINCGEMKRITGLSMLCIHNAECACTRDHNVIHEADLFPISEGTMLMIHIYFGQQSCRIEELGEAAEMPDDATSLMHNPLRTLPAQAAPDPFLMTWLYGFCYGLEEPIRVWRGGAGGLAPSLFIAQQYAHLIDTVLKEQILAFKVFPQPADLTRSFVEAYVLIIEENIKPWECLILLDTTWEAQADTSRHDEKTREVKVTGHQITKEQFLRQVGLDPHCSRPHKLCIVTIRGRHWDDEHEFATILNGDFCTITVRNRPLSRAPQLAGGQGGTCDNDAAEANRPRHQQDLSSRASGAGGLQNHSEGYSQSQVDEAATSEPIHGGRARNDSGATGGTNNHDDSSLVQAHIRIACGSISLPLGNISLDSPMERADYDFQAEEEIRTRNIQQGEEQLRLLIQETVALHGEYHLFAEIRALLEREEPEITLVTHGLAARHLGSKQVTLDNRRALEPRHIIGRIIEAWISEIQWETMKIIYVTPQPFEVDPENRDWIHLIVDFRPNLEGIPLLSRISFFFHGGDEGEFETTRLTLPHLAEIFERLGLEHICGQREASCRISTLRVRFYQLEDRIPIPVGSYFMIDIYREEAMRDPEDEDDESMLMVTGTSRRLRYFFVYRADDSEPLAIQRFDPTVVSMPGNSDAERLSYQYLHSGKSNGERSVTMYILNDQPDNMFAFSAEGYMAVNDDVGVEQGALTLIDIGFYLRGSQMTMRGPVPNDEWRETKFLPWNLDKVALLKELGLWNFCREPEDSCDVWHRGAAWERGARQMRHGDYIVVKVLQRNENLPLNLQWQLAQDCDQDLLDSLRSQEDHDAPRTNNASLPIENSAASEEHGSASGAHLHENEDDDEEDLSVLLMIQRRYSRWSASAAWYARERLPPPGNGPVKFSKWVKIYDDNGHHISEDRSCENHLIADFCSTRDGDAVENPFFRNCIQQMRFSPPCNSWDEDERARNLKGQSNSAAVQKDLNSAPTSDDPRIILPISDNIDDRHCRREDKRHRTHGDKQGSGFFWQVGQLKHLLEQHCTIPQYEGDGLAWKEVSKCWNQLEPWVLSDAMEVHVYVDGSSRDGKQGAAAVMYILTPGGWRFGGFTAKPCPEASNSFEAELESHMLAGKWIWDTIRLLHFSGFALPKCVVHYDCESAAMIANGRWQQNEPSKAMHITRTFQHILYTQFGIELCLQYDKAHNNNPGNEAADSAAGWAAQLSQQEGIWDQLWDNGCQMAIQWIWILFRDDVEDIIKDGELHIPKPTACFDSDVCEALEFKREIEVPESFRWNLNICSYNVMTMNSRCWKGRGTGPGSVESLLRQLHGNGYHIFAVQEARLKTPPSSANEWYHVLHTPPVRGCGGLLFGISKKLAIGKGSDKKKIYIRQQDVKVVFMESEKMLLRVVTPAFQCMILVAHGPHAGIAEDEVTRWWQETTRSIPSRHRDLPMIFIGDPNARMCSIDENDDTIGSFQGDNMNHPGLQFYHFLQRHRMWAPSTFEAFQKGSGITWRHPKQGEARLDFITLPKAWMSFDISARVVDDIVANDILHDHSPIEMRVGGVTEKKQQPMSWTKKHKQMRVDFTSENNRNVLHFALKEIPRCPWHMDVHRHAHQLQEGIRVAMNKCTPPQRYQHKTYLKEDTWEAINKKRSLKKIYFSQRSQVDHTLMGIFFNQWRRDTQEALSWGHLYPEVLRDKVIAEQTFRRQSILSQQLVRRDDETFFEGLLQRFEIHDNPSSQRELWKEVKRNNKGLRDKRRMLKATQFDFLDEHWVPFWCDLESGTTMTPEELYRGCLKRQNEQQHEPPPIEEIPTLIELEHSLKQTKMRKRGGPDEISPDVVRLHAPTIASRLWDLTCKQWSWNTEAIQFKGGELAMIPKPKANHSTMEGFRGVVMSSILGKRLQSISRQQMVTILSPSRPQGQIGGYQGKEPSEGAHYIRLTSRIAARKGVPLGTIFIDLQKAYHHLIRSLAVGVDEESAKENNIIRKQLHDQGQELLPENHPAIREGKMQRCGASNSATQNARDANMDCWTLAAGATIRTRKGSRPGSPLADIMFMAALSDVYEEFENTLAKYIEVSGGASRLGISLKPIFWADDMAIQVPVEENSQLFEVIPQVMRDFDMTLSQRGFKVNYAKAKTETILTPSGKGSQEIRRELLSMATPTLGMGCLREETQSTRLRVQARYRHLGCMQSCYSRRFMPALGWHGRVSVKSENCFATKDTA